jgi:hypothetical protein
MVGMMMSVVIVMNSAEAHKLFLFQVAAPFIPKQACGCQECFSCPTNFSLSTKFEISRMRADRVTSVCAWFEISLVRKEIDKLKFVGQSLSDSQRWL